MMIRSAVRPDRDAIAALLERRKLFTREEMSVALEVIDTALDHPEKEDYFVFCSGSTETDLDGYICFGPVPLTEGCWDLYWIAVDEVRSRTGVGGRLLACMEEMVMGHGGRRIYIDTSSTPGYAPARAFYRRKGFHPVCVLKDFYRPGDDKVIFRLRFPVFTTTSGRRIRPTWRS
jgi:GNAT superfamily N-acetyltransferase